MLRQITVATYNIFHGRQTGEIAKNVAKLAARGADVICLQEVRVIPGRHFLGAILERTLGPEWRAEYLLGPGFDLGLATYWLDKKLSFLGREEILLPKIKRYHPGRQLASFHAKPLQRGALSLTLGSGKAVIRITNVHLDWQGGLAHRSGQLSGLISALDKKGRVPQEIICGDLNTVGPRIWQNLQERRFQAVLGPSFTHASQGIRKSWRLGNLKSEEPLPPGQKILSEIKRRIAQRLDYIWSSGLGVEEASVLHLPGSDHLPMIGTFSFKISR